MRQGKLLSLLATTAILLGGTVPAVSVEIEGSASASAQQLDSLSAVEVTAAALEQISRQLNQPAQMRGEFRQHKLLPNLPRPLQSHGHIALSQERGISWRTLQPVPSHIVMGGEGEGDSANAFSRQLAEPMMNILRGNFAALEQMFYVDAGYEVNLADASADDNWKMSLRPRSARLQKYLNAIEIFGGDSIRRIRLLEGNQSVTDIEFLNMQPVAAQDAQFLAEFDAD
ncbi:outer membrane lipoprotein carrier protein LolA [Microbulbifer bruguierae]|uniref:Outer membrane lipoprotein carrier protein LolA n=1 Tax=Microbulbifer bruguierae TaxID=3029061 RepID=A0ABY8N9X1_9GAMM|nr:outer membrane lipoprotein carrier protein LolA [Microbulbifer bruguierae]WGL15275.1 outer membrane lipoprotein carrier protein LolA [Microbulbifer bruguierae]